MNDFFPANEPNKLNEPNKRLYYHQMNQMKDFILTKWTKWKTLFLPNEPNERPYSYQMNQMKDLIPTKWTKWKTLFLPNEPNETNGQNEPLTKLIRLEFLIGFIMNHLNLFRRKKFYFTKWTKCLSTIPYINQSWIFFFFL